MYARNSQATSLDSDGKGKKKTMLAFSIRFDTYIWIWQSMVYTNMWNPT